MPYFWGPYFQSRTFKKNEESNFALAYHKIVWCSMWVALVSLRLINCLHCNLWNILLFAVECPPGKYWNSTLSNCIYCPLGTYQDEPNQESCKSCPNQKITATTGTQNSSDCFSTKFDIKGKWVRLHQRSFQVIETCGNGFHVFLIINCGSNSNQHFVMQQREEELCYNRAQQSPLMCVSAQLLPD